MDLERLMKLDLGYPGISFGYHSWSLGIYLEMLEDMVVHASQQYRSRAQQALQARAHELEDGLYMQELNHIDEAADEHIPSYARMSAVLLIWGIFESTVSDIARYLANRDSITLKLRDVRADTFLTRVDSYFTDVLNLPLPWTTTQIQSAQKLKYIRDAVAHRNGQFTDAPKEHIAKLKSVTRGLPGVRVSSNQLTVGTEFVESSSVLVFSMIESLNICVSSRYCGPPT